MLSDGGFDSISVLRGAGTGAITAAVLLLLGTFALYLTQEPAAALPVAAVVIAWLSVLAGGFSAARRAGRAGVWHGASAGLLLFLALYLAGVLTYDLPMQPLGLLVRLVLSLFVGGIGGAIGLAL